MLEPAQPVSTTVRVSRPSCRTATSVQAEQHLDLLQLTRASAPLRCTLWWCAGRELEPGVAGLFPNRDRGRGKTRICEVADGDGNVTGKALALHIYGGAAGRAEVEGDRVAALGGARPGSGFSGEINLLAAEDRLVADDGAGATLALQTVTHRDARGLALDGEVELAAAAGGVPGGHGVAPVSSCVAHSSASWSRLPNLRLNSSLAASFRGLSCLIA